MGLEFTAVRSANLKVSIVADGKLLVVNSRRSIVVRRSSRISKGPKMYTKHHSQGSIVFKGIVSRDFGGLQMIWMVRICVPDVPLEVYSFLIFIFI